MDIFKTLREMKQQIVGDKKKEEPKKKEPPKDWGEQEVENMRKRKKQMEDALNG